MLNYILTVLGIIATVIVSRYFFLKSNRKKELSCFVQNVSLILDNIEPEIKNKLTIIYDSQKLTNLYQVHFVIGNTGDYAIRDIINPLTLQLPLNNEILEYKIEQIEPVGREISIQVINLNELQFIIPLLNSGEFFIIKLLIKGNVPDPINFKHTDDKIKVSYSQFLRYNMFKFTICVDDLPPEIISERLPIEYLSSHGYRSIDDSPQIALYLLLWSLIIAYSLFGYKYSNNEFFLFNFKLFFKSFSLLKFSIFSGWALSVTFFVISMILFFTETNFKRRIKPKFKLPPKK